MALRAEDQFHVGIVVEDFEAALAGLSALFGYQWCDELGGPTEVRLRRRGPAELQVRVLHDIAPAGDRRAHPGSAAGPGAVLVGAHQREQLMTALARGEATPSAPRVRPMVGMATGAGRGMGLACARRLTGLVDMLLLVDRDEATAAYAPPCAPKRK